MAIPRLAITAGEPAGIGPDIVLTAAGQPWPAELVVIADQELMYERAAALCLEIDLQPVEFSLAAQAHRPGILKILPTPLRKSCKPGHLDSGNAAYVMDTLHRAVRGCLDGDFQALVTAPVQKSIINDAGIPFSGHTEFLAEATGSDNVVMMLAAGDLRVALATTHLPLSQVPAAITPRLLRETLTILDTDLKIKFGVEKPRIAVLGLNPHAGEDGHLGREELDVIIPTLSALSKDGLDLQGPLPADTAFNRKILDQCDAIFAMYHDQGLPVLKYAGFGEAINITLGLPIVRVSVDHGTALDLAGSGNADAGSMKAALDLAIKIAKQSTDIP